jgi:hypothetical protein
MKLVITLFMLATIGSAVAQQPGDPMGRSGGQQPTTPGAQVPGATQPRPTVPDSADQSGAQPGSPGQAANAPVTEGCLGGSAPNFTITDTAGTTYKLNIPPGANASVLSQHLGESVQVQGDVSSGKAASIDVQRIGRGTGTCAGSGSTGAQPPPKQ